ncbi:peptidylprolyl isomerase [candidate division KSB1 bacterium]|nr:peptidylprolyl isomerase [candidate division KSB1 bacterium]
MRYVFKFLGYSFIPLLLVLSISTCSKDKKESKNPAFYADSTLVAFVNGLSVSYDDIAETAKNMLIQNNIGSRMDYRDSLIQHEALEWIISNELLKKEIDNHTIEVLDAEIDRGVDIMKNNFPSEQAFLEALSKDGQTMRQFREQVMNGIKIRKLLEQEVFDKDYAVTESEAKSYYKKNPDEFTEAGKIRVRHILVKVPRTASATVAEKAKEKINTVYQKIQQGEDFAALAQRYSEDASAQRGGDIGFFARGDLLAEFDNVAFSLRVGEVSEIVRTDLGFHIIKLIETKESNTVPFDKVQDDLIAFLEQKKKDDALKTYIDGLKSKADIAVKENWYKIGVSHEPK